MIPAGMGMMAPALAPWSGIEFAFVFAMWAVMMIGMMTPSAAPMILIYARVGRRAAIADKPFAATGWFATGYLLAWVGLALSATVAQWALDWAKAIVGEASRLEKDAAARNQKVQQLELDFNRSQHDDEATAKDVNESLLVLQAAADRLGQMQKPGSHSANKRALIESSRAVRRCIHFLRFARLPIISSRRPLSCTL